MSTIVDRGVGRLHELAWRPGAWMHEAWWGRLSLDDWRASYLARPACRPSIDRLIVMRRAFPMQALPASLCSWDQLLIALEPRLPALVTALGVVALGCVDHLLLKSHREALANHLDLKSCDQLLALHDSWDAGAACLPPSRLAQMAFSVGARWWHRDAQRNVCARLLATLLPPGDDRPCTNEGCAVEHVVKLSRFL
ncbi:type III secretion system domain-containing protein [Trinickia sp. EG282A]|uniref:type III secretion system domain-containing protein n=1 Tax=Trinickia sp. EG282A TaxID=3237013 RepID=UPI0034D1B798